MLPFLSASLPKIVGIGLQGVFEIIRESRQAYPNVCRRALTSLLNILQGLQPEELAQEPASVMEPTFETLLELASSVSPTALEAGAGSGLVTNEIYVLFAVLKKKLKSFAWAQLYLIRLHPNKTETKTLSGKVCLEFLEDS